jgi:SAM-dependent methyltransferase
MFNAGIERQVGTVLEDIRGDHKERYLWAASRLGANEIILDAGCGVGYGSKLLAQRVASVHAIDISEEAVTYAKKYWPMPNVTHAVEDACFFHVDGTRRYDAIVAFEVVEHLIEPRLFLLKAFDALKTGGRIFVSVPNERIIPHTVTLNPFHLKHYTLEEICELLLSCGFEVKAVASQNVEEITESDSGRFLVLEAERQSACPGELHHDFLSQYALTRAADFVVARAVAIHRATKDVKKLKQQVEDEKGKLAEASRNLAMSLQAQASSSKDSLVTDLMRRVQELESFERDSRDRLTKAEMNRQEQLTLLQKLEKEREILKNQVTTADKMAKAAGLRSKEAESRLLAIGNDCELLVEANAELLQKLSKSDDKVSQLTSNVQALRTALKRQDASVKPPPTLGGIYKKLSFHRFYLPFLYKAVRNSLRNQSRRVGAGSSRR